MNLQADSIKDKKVIIGGAVKNVARFFQDNKNEIERIGALFNDYAVVIYENNSIDATKYVYERWAQENKRVIFLSEDLSEEYLKKYTPLIADFRTQLIARARNKILDVASNHIFDDYDYVIMMDLDDFEPLDLVP
jgi:Asp-tRNA(Asn)/Glu-tRNA(Gln) amidotransferase A subunit family amidase